MPPSGWSYRSARGADLPSAYRDGRKDVFSIVDPGDVPWVFLSHDDVHYAGNLAEVMEACPNATLISTWFMVERYSNAFKFPLERCRWVNDGESWRAGDLTLTAITPPLFDSPVRRGLRDDRTGVYWAVDSFATPLPGPMEGARRRSPRGGWSTPEDLLASQTHSKRWRGASCANQHVRFGPDFTSCRKILRLTVLARPPRGPNRGSTSSGEKTIRRGSPG